MCPDNLTVGEHCSLNEGSLLHCVGNVVLGNNVTVSAGAKIFSTQYDVSHWTESEKHYHLRKSVFINDGCWICSGGGDSPRSVYKWKECYSGGKCSSY